MTDDLERQRIAKLLNGRRPHGFDLLRRTGTLRVGERHDRAGVRPLASERPIWTGGPWSARVAMQPWATRTGTTHRVIVSWTGPPLAGAEPADGPVQVHDFIDVDDHERATRVARAAADLLGRPERPDLMVLAAAP